jgi:general secretion pathway protein D
VKREGRQSGTGPWRAIELWAGRCTTLMLLGIFPAMADAQTAGVPAKPPQAAQTARQSAQVSPQKSDANAVSDRHVRGSARRRAAKEYLAASKLFLAGKFEKSRLGFERAAELDPTNANYTQAAQVARNHEVTALLQQAAKDRLLGNQAAERAAVRQAYELEPKNFEVSEHLDELGGDIAPAQQRPLYQDAEDALGGPVQLEYATGLKSFHVRAAQREVIAQVFKSYGIEAMIDQSVGANVVRIDLGDATFNEATRALDMATDTFYVPLDAHRALVARDTPQNRDQFTRLSLETLYLPGLSSDTMTEVSNLARNVFGAQEVAPDASGGRLVVRAPQLDLEAFNSTIKQLLDGTSQVILDVKIIQVAHTSGTNTGVAPPQAITAFNVYTEEQSFLNQNQALVQQIISSGLAAPGDTLAILGILLASGQVSSPLLSQGFALFGGGLTQSALSPGPATANFALNSTDSRELDDVDLRLGDDKDGTLKLGTRYPIETSSYSSLSPTVPTIPGLTSPGSSSGLSSLLAGLTGAIPTIPQVEYQDIGLALKVRPRVLRNGSVALSLNLKLDSLAGASVNGLPVLNNRSYEGVVMLRQSSAAVIGGDINQSESRALTGTPGLSDLPGMNNVTEKNLQQNYATLLIVITPHVVRGTQAAGHSQMFKVVNTRPAAP